MVDVLHGTCQSMDVVRTVCVHQVHSNGWICGHSEDLLCQHCGLAKSCYGMS